MDEWIWGMTTYGIYQILIYDSMKKNKKIK